MQTAKRAQSPQRAKPNKQKKRAAYARSQKSAEEAEPSTDTEQQLPDVVEGDAAQDASEPEEETQNPELDIEIATGRRYALIAKNLDVVTAASAERTRTATHKLVCELYGSPLPLLDHVCDGKPTGAIEIMVEDQAILKPEEHRVLDGCNVIRLSLDEAKLPENPAERRAYRSALRKLALRRACFSLPRPARSPASHSNARHAHRAPRASRFAAPRPPLPRSQWQVTAAHDRYTTTSRPRPLARRGRTYGTEGGRGA